MLAGDGRIVGPLRTTAHASRVDGQIGGWFPGVVKAQAWHNAVVEIGTARGAAAARRRPQTRHQPTGGATGDSRHTHWKSPTAMTTAPILPYFDFILAMLAQQNDALEKSFGRH